MICAYYTTQLTNYFPYTTNAINTAMLTTDGLAGSSAAVRRKSSSSTNNNSTTTTNGGITSLDAAAIVSAALKRSANSSVSSGSGSSSSGRDRIVDPSKVSDSSVSDTSTAVLPLNMYQFAGIDAPRPTDPICAVAANASTLLIALESGAVQRYSLPLLTLEGRYTVACVPGTLSLNCDGTLCGIIDRSGMLTVLPLVASDDDSSSHRHSSSSSSSSNNKHNSSSNSNGGYINGRARVSAADWSTFERKVRNVLCMCMNECTVLRHYILTYCFVANCT
jgi:hypothetical protein